jgi:hypothetical protein
MAKRAPRPGEGTPPKYRKEFAELAKKLAAQGNSVRVIALHCGNVQSKTIYEWASEKSKHLQFREGLRMGRALRLEQLEFMLHCHQMGIVTKNFDPKKSSLAAIMFELKCIFHEDWSDKQKIIDMIQQAGGRIQINIDSTDAKL